MDFFEDVGTIIMGCLGLYLIYRIILKPILSFFGMDIRNDDDDE